MTLSLAHRRAILTGGLLKLLIFTFFHCKFMRVAIFFQKISFYKNYLYMYMCLFSRFFNSVDIYFKNYASSV